MTISKNSEILTLKGFLKVFEYDRIGQLACEAIRRDYMETQRKLYDQIKQQKLKRKMKVILMETDRKSRMKYISINNGLKTNSQRSESQMSVGSWSKGQNI
jgi:hypothetical protein